MSFKDEKQSLCRRGRPRVRIVPEPSLVREISQSQQTKQRDPVRDPFRHRLARDLAAAVVCRLGIPDDKTIVGFLGVGRTTGNREEVERWVAVQLESLEEQGWTGCIDTLCRRLASVLDRVSPQ